MDYNDLPFNYFQVSEPKRSKNSRKRWRERGRRQRRMGVGDKRKRMHANAYLRNGELIKDDDWSSGSEDSGEEWEPTEKERRTMLWQYQPPVPLDPGFSILSDDDLMALSPPPRKSKKSKRATIRVTTHVPNSKSILSDSDDGLMDLSPPPRKNRRLSKKSKRKTK